MNENYATNSSLADYELPVEEAPILVKLERDIRKQIDRLRTSIESIGESVDEISSSLYTTPKCSDELLEKKAHKETRPCFVDLLRENIYFLDELSERLESIEQKLNQLI